MCYYGSGWFIFVTQNPELYCKSVVEINILATERAVI